MYISLSFIYVSDAVCISSDAARLLTISKCLKRPCKQADICRNRAASEQMLATLTSIGSEAARFLHVLAC